MEKKTVLVTGIGGNVGQGILRNIASLQWPIHLIGTDIATFSAGSHLCHATYQVPYAFDPGYIAAIQSIVERESVDLIIPSTDYEIYYLSLHASEISAVIAASLPETAKIYLDKYETYRYLTQHGIPFATSWLPKDFDFSVSEIIAKPREGRGSRGILLQPSAPDQLDDSYMIQPLLKGIEITTAAYATQNQDLLGVFTMERSLTNGTTTESKVVFDYDETMHTMAKAMIKLGGLRGSFNIQSIVTDSGDIVPFEINCRISGTNSIRHNLGFQDVKYTLQEFLYQEQPDQPNPIPGRATRILMDVIYPDAPDTALNLNTPHKIY